MKVDVKNVCAVILSAACCGCMTSTTLKPTVCGKVDIPAKVDRHWAEKLTRAEVSAEGLNYRIYIPDGIGPSEKVPLVFFLHGAGERGTNNTIQLIWAVPQLISYSMRNNLKAIIVAPQCPKDIRWFETNWNEVKHSSPDEPSVTMAKVIKLLDKMLDEYPVDKDRVYLTGLSMGGYGTWDLASRRPELFAAALPVCGGGDVSKASKLAKLPIMTVHGDKDTAVPVENSRRMVKAVRAAGGKVEYQELAGQGHGVWGYTYGTDKNLDWFFSHRRR